MCSISSVLFTKDPRVETISLDSIKKKHQQARNPLPIQAEHFILDGFFTKFADPNQCWRGAAKFVRQLLNPYLKAPQQWHDPRRWYRHDRPNLVCVVRH